MTHKREGCWTRLLKEASGIAAVLPAELIRIFRNLAKGNGRTWMVRLFIGGFCLLLLGIFLKVVSRIL
ncbi:MAG TPA: hypothetical protein VGP89_00530 [Candidatus Angelobacter sp.]|jgi:hypothetical protein|nr:hypothetical protein [Candidatus Angelobacter sp.]